MAAAAGGGAATRATAANSPGAKRRPDRTGIPALSQCPAGGGTRAGPGLPHRHLTAMWWPRTWLCHSPAGRHSPTGPLFPASARGAAQAPSRGFRLLSGTLGWVPGWESGPGRGPKRAGTPQSGPLGWRQAKGQQMRPVGGSPLCSGRHRLPSEAPQFASPVAAAAVGGQGRGGRGVGPR